MTREEIVQYVSRADTTDLALAKHFGYEERVHLVAAAVDALVAEGRLAEVGCTRIVETDQVVRVLGLPRPKAASRTDAVLETYQRWARCTRCSLSHTRKHVVYARGSIHAPVVAISMSPTEEEDDSGMPMHGDPSYAAIKKALDLNGFAPTADGGVLACCMVACMPRDSLVGGVREARHNEIAACSLHVQELLCVVQPRVVVLMGSAVVQAFFDRVPPSFPFWKHGVCFLKTYAATEVALRPDLLQSACIEWRYVKEALLRAMGDTKVPNVPWTIPMPV